MQNQNTKIFFDEALHKYTDEYGNTYTSVTTLIGKYGTKFDSNKMARNCARAGRKGNPKYKGKTEAMLKAEWDFITKTACEEGTDKHNFLESSIKKHTGFNLKNNPNYTKNRIYTIEDILHNPTYGRLDFDFFISSGIKDRYPKIFTIISVLHDQGYVFYAEIGVFDMSALVSGLIDLLAVKDTIFYIIDWKTNKAPIKYEAGYFVKNKYGELTNEFVYTNTKLKKPLNYLEDSVGNKYALQLSTYAVLTEKFKVNDVNLKCKGLLLCHITKKTDFAGTITEDVEILIIPFLKDAVELMIDDFVNTAVKKKQTLMNDLFN